MRYHWRRSTVLGMLDRLRARRYQLRHRRAIDFWQREGRLDAYGLRIWTDWARNALNNFRREVVREYVRDAFNPTDLATWKAELESEGII